MELNLYKVSKPTKKDQEMLDYIENLKEEKL